jgi:hypothetical protein
MDRKKFSELEKKLTAKYPQDSWGSPASLFGRGLREGDITKEEYNDARVLIGRLWNYAGD